MYARPGTHFLYGLNFDVLGRVIELVSGLSLDTYMHDNVFAPLGMTDTAFYIDGETDKGKAQLKRLVPCYDFVPGFGCQVSSSPGKPRCNVYDCQIIRFVCMSPVPCVCLCVCARVWLLFRITDT
jgi:CubicO group peptidase (beta-lactamase class C family)